MKYGFGEMVVMDEILHVDVSMLRHGDRIGGEMTELGVRQVRASISEHLRGCDIVAGYCNAKERTRIVAEMAGAEARWQHPVEYHADFDPEWVLSPSLPQYDATRLEKELVGATVYDLLEQFPPAWAIMSQVRRGVCEVAAKSLKFKKMGEPDPAVVVGTQTWIGEMAVPVETVGEARLMDLGDVYVYRVRVESRSELCLPPMAEIVGFEHLRCPI